MKRLIVGISGASGAIYGVRLLQVLQSVPDIETHLVMSNAARQTLTLETDLTLRDVQALADVVHDSRDIAASISSGSFKTTGMVILPCSVKTLSGIVNSYTGFTDACGGCCAQGKASSGALRARNPATSGAFTADDAGSRAGRDYYAAGSGVLSPAGNRGRYHRSDRQPGDRPV